ncbi:NAD-dependent dehydratase, partial [Flavobacterium sp. LBUM151]
EKIYDQLEKTNVTFLRAGFFYTNTYNDAPMIKGAGIMGANYPAGLKMPLVHPKDIAAAAAEELQKDAKGKTIRDIISDVRTPNEIATALGTAIGKTDLPWIEFTDEQSLQGMTQAGLPEEIAGLYTEMGSGLRSGKITEHFLSNNFSVDGKIKLEEFAKEFAEKF